MSPAALLGSPDRKICLQDALRGSCLLGFQLFTFLIKSFDLLPEQRCTLYTGSEWGHVYSWDGFFWSHFQKFHCIQINQDLSSCSVNYYTYRMQYPSLAHLRNMEEVCVLSVTLTNHRSARLTVALIRYGSARKYPYQSFIEKSPYQCEI